MPKLVHVAALHAAALYAGLFLLALIPLIAIVIRTRFATRVPLGDGGNDAMRRAIRVHGNFVETVPFGLLAMILLVLEDARPWLVHLVGAPLVLGRIAHRVGLGATSGPSTARAAGMVLTFAGLGFAAVGLILLALQ
jgi:uncharacterized membrane protein YecN with MAPEG domain